MADLTPLEKFAAMRAKSLGIDSNKQKRLKKRKMSPHEILQQEVSDTITHFQGERLEGKELEKQIASEEKKNKQLKKQRKQMEEADN